MIYYRRMECVTGVSRDLFKFWEISDNISLTVQDSYIVAMEH